MQILNFILQSLAGVFSFALLARFTMQWARAPFRNPIGQFVIAVTDWAVRPARRVIPTAWGHDLPSLVLAWLAQAMYLGVIYSLGGLLHPSLHHVGVLATTALIDTAIIACNLVFVVVIISALLSWINPHAPLAPVINAVAGPLLRPFQQIVPPIGGIDLSPIALLFVLKLIEFALASGRSGLLASLLMTQ